MVIQSLLIIYFSFLTSSGRSFHALDSGGHIHVWGKSRPYHRFPSSNTAWNLGTLNGESFIMGDGFVASGKPAKTPVKLDIPATMRSIK